MKKIALSIGVCIALAALSGCGDKPAAAAAGAVPAPTEAAAATGDAAKPAEKKPDSGW